MSYDELRDYLRSRSHQAGRPTVAVERVEGRSVQVVRAAVEQILRNLSAEEMLSGWRGHRVLLKPNFCREGRPGETTSMEAMDALLGVLKDWSCEVVFGDGMTQAYLPPRAPNGFDHVAALVSPIAKKHGIPFVHLASPPKQTITVNADGFSFSLPSILQEVVGMVNLAVLKVHPQMVGAFAVKNLMGLLSGPDRLQMHRSGVAKGIWGLESCVAKLVPQQIHVVDGLASFQGYETPSVEPGVFVGGLDPCAVDLACALIMGIDPHRQFPQYRVPLREGFGYARGETICWKGTPIDDVRFQCHIPPQVMDAPLFPSVRIIWGQFDYPINRAIVDLLRHMDRDLPLDIYVGGAVPTADNRGRWSICMGNASLENYRGGCTRIVTVPGDPPAGVDFVEVVSQINESLETHG